MFKLQKDVSVPEPKNSTYPFRKMNVNDSFFVPGEDEKGKTYMAAKMFRYRNKEYKFTIRKENNGIRIWRVKA